MTDQEWKTICFLVEEWWPPSPAEGDFDEGRRRAWRLALDGYMAEQIVTGLKVLLARGGKWRPRVSELIAEIRKDSSTPIWIEAEKAIFGPGGVLRARATPGQRYGSEAQMMRAHDDAALERARTMHPLIFEFVRRQGIDRLKHIEIDHPEYGEIRRKELREDWDRLVEVFEDRETVALASGRREEGLAQLDPLKVLGGPWVERARREIGAGT